MMIIFDRYVILCSSVNPDVAASIYLAGFVFLYVQLVASKVILHEAPFTMYTILPSSSNHRSYSIFKSYVEYKAGFS
jgi:nitrate/TMAO reductase-like tetraheme cytochrome c subunit